MAEWPSGTGAKTDLLLHASCDLEGMFLTSKAVAECGGIYWDEEWCIITVCPCFSYTISGFPALTVEMRQVRIQRPVYDGKMMLLYAMTPS